MKRFFGFFFIGGFYSLKNLRETFLKENTNDKGEDCAIERQLDSDSGIAAGLLGGAALGVLGGALIGAAMTDDSPTVVERNTMVVHRSPMCYERRTYYEPPPYYYTPPPPTIVLTAPPPREQAILTLPAPETMPAPKRPRRRHWVRFTVKLGQEPEKSVRLALVDYDESHDIGAAKEDIRATDGLYGEQPFKLKRSDLRGPRAIVLRSKKRTVMESNTIGELADRLGRGTRSMPLELECLLYPEAGYYNRLGGNEIEQAIKSPGELLKGLLDRAEACDCKALVVKHLGLDAKQLKGAAVRRLHRTLRETRPQAEVKMRGILQSMADELEVAEEAQVSHA